jgi:zinc protease
MGTPEWIHADLLTTLLAGDKASRLEKALVFDKQIATDVAAYVLPTEATGMLMLQATAQEGIDIAEVEATIDEELARIASGSISADELTRAMNRAEMEFAHQLENYDTRADLLGMMSTYFNDPSLIDRWLDAYRAATAEDLAGIARKFLVPENRVTSLFVPEAA